jgi:hypothetical protein
LDVNLPIPDFEFAAEWFKLRGGLPMLEPGVVVCPEHLGRDAIPLKLLGREFSRCWEIEDEDGEPE